VRNRPAAAQHLRELARLRRVRDRIDREYAQPLDVEALARDAHMSRGRAFPFGYSGSLGTSTAHWRPTAAVLTLSKVDVIVLR
jgi:transcriptional regulator GlxA family with amidase domain